MSETPLQAGGALDERNNTRMYLGVIVVEVLVLVAIWWFQRHFGS